VLDDLLIREDENGTWGIILGATANNLSREGENSSAGESNSRE